MSVPCQSAADCSNQGECEGGKCVCYAAIIGDKCETDVRILFFHSFWRCEARFSQTPQNSHLCAQHFDDSTFALLFHIYEGIYSVLFFLLLILSAWSLRNARAVHRNGSTLPVAMSAMFMVGDVFRILQLATDSSHTMRQGDLLVRMIWSCGIYFCTRSLTILTNCLAAFKIPIVRPPRDLVSPASPQYAQLSTVCEYV